MAQWWQAPPVPHAMMSHVRLYAISRCTRGQNDTPCRDVVLPGELHDASPCPICSRVRPALFQGLEHNRALELAVEALHPDMPGLAMGEHWDPTVPPLLPIQHPPVQRDPVAKPKVKAYVRVGGANQGFRAPADAARQPPPPPLPNVIGGAQGVRVASVPILSRRGNVPARVAVVQTPPPPPPPPVGATPPHAVQGGKVPSHVPPVGAKPPHAGQWGHVPSHAFAGGLQGPPSGSRGLACVSQPPPGWAPPVPAGPPPPRQAPDVVDLTVTRRTFVSGDTLQHAKALRHSRGFCTAVPGPSFLKQSTQWADRRPHPRLTVMRRSPLSMKLWRPT